MKPSRLVTALEHRWAALCKSSGVTSAATAKWYDIIRGGYEEPWRHYHTLAHLEELFEYADAFSKELEDHAAVELAIFFHDVVYLPKARPGKNEDDSAQVFSQFAQEVDLGPALRVSRVFRWIVQTKYHACQPDDEADCKLFMDFDMAVLGRQRSGYEKYAQDVRHEFCHVPDAIWCSARAQFLESTASSKAVFATDTFKARCEQTARSNMQWEAKQLRERYMRLGCAQKLVARLYQTVKKHRCSIIIGAAAAVTIPVVWFLPQTALTVACVTAAASVTAMGLIALPLGAYLCVGAPLVRYPFPPPSAAAGVCVYAGSFNPPHNGHLELLRYLAERHSKVHVVIGMNPSKSYPVDPYVRRSLLTNMVKGIGLQQNVEVSVVSGYIWRFALDVGAESLFRGIRSWRQDGAEEKQLEALNLVGPMLLALRLPIRTTYLQANPRWSHVSSTLVRECLKRGTGLESLVPACAVSEVGHAYAHLARTS